MLQEMRMVLRVIACLNGDDMPTAAQVPHGDLGRR
jgi:hypothetical protein